MIELKDLYKSFGKVDVFSGINLTIQSGKITGVAGRNGAGKTTLFRCIAGLEDHGGEVVSTPKEFKNKIGFLPADPYFMSQITGREYLQLLANVKTLVIKDFESRNVFDLPLSQYASTYSTGMKKKLAITGILLQEHEVLLLDEPFNGVDIQSNVLINEIIRRLRSKGKTIILASHILGTLSDLCDEIHILDGGSIARSVEKGDFESLTQEMIDPDFQQKLDRLGL